MFIVLTANHLHFAVRPALVGTFARPLAALSAAGIESFQRKASVHR
jgi:hypothetical protein